MENYSEKYKDHPILSQMREMQREDLLRVINGAYFAERFFGRSGSWFSQKLNGNIKNGKPCSFTPEEIEKLRNAIYTIAFELEELADGLQEG